MDELIKQLRNRRICIQQSGGLEDFPLLCEAADAIEKMSSYAELYKDLAEKNQQMARKLIEERPCWIPVIERLPEIGTRCVTVSKDGEYGFALYSDMGWMLPYYMGKTEYWMPLPEPPKEG